MRYSFALNDLRVFEQRRRLVVVAEISHTGPEHNRHEIDSYFIDQPGSERLSGKISGS